MVAALRKVGVWIAYRLNRVYWWIRRPVVLGVRVLVSDGNQVLIVRHSYRKGWFLPGGTPELGESLAETARRECKEETGVSVSNLTLLGIYSSLAGPESDHVAVFRGEVHGLGIEQASASRTPEVKSVRWVAADQLPDAMSAQTQLILQDWLQGRTGIYRVTGLTQRGAASPEN